MASQLSLVWVIPRGEGAPRLDGARRASGVLDGSSRLRRRPILAAPVVPADNHTGANCASERRIEARPEDLVFIHALIADGGQYRERRRRGQ